MREFICGNITCSGEKFVYSSDEKTVECTLECRLGLREFEKQYFVFTENFVKNKLSKYLPVVYSVYSPDYSEGTDVCRARYLLHPFDGTALVLHIDRDYYSARGCCGEKIPEKRDIVKKREIAKCKGELSEYGKYDYTETISVSAKATCHDGDKYLKETGEAVSLAKAMVKMSKRIAGVYDEIRDLLDSAQEDLTSALFTHCNIASGCQDIIASHSCE